MALVTANGLTAFDFQLRRPRVGAWHADLRVETSEALQGRVDIVIDDGFRTFKGTAFRSREFAEIGMLRVIAGAGGLGLAAEPKHYNDPTVGIILGDLLRAAGETLSGTVDQSVLRISLASWTTPAMPVGVVIAHLLEAATASAAAWRMLPDGTFWVGFETWPGAGIDPSVYEIMDEAAEDASMVVQFDRPELEPGTTFEGRRISYVQDDVPHTEPVQTRIWFEDGDVETDLSKMREALAALVRATTPKFDYRGHYWGRIVSQSGSTIDVVIDGPGVPDMGKVQLAAPAGLSINGAASGRVLVGWSLPDLKAYAIAFDDEATVATRTIKADQVVVDATMTAIGGAGGEPPAKATTLITWLSTHTHAGVTSGGAISGPPAVPPPPGIAATKAVVT